MPPWPPRAPPAGVRLRATAVRAEALRLLPAGELDVVYQVPVADAIAFTRDHPSSVRFRYEQPAFHAAVYNARRPALASAAHRRALTALLDRAGVAAAAEDLLTRTQAVQIVACGSSYHAALVAKYWYEKIPRVPTEVDIASEFRYRGADMPQGGLALFISQSGETADTLAAIDH